MTARPGTSSPDTGIPDLIRRLTEDSRRLVTDEVQLARMEARESLQGVTRGALWMALAFGAGIVTLVSLTIFLVTFIGRLANGHMWVGALVTGLVDLGLGGVLVMRGVRVISEPSYTLAQSRAALKDTAHWVSPGQR